MKTMPENKSTKSPSSPKQKLAGERYIEAIGRRKTAIARVRLMKGTGKITVGEKSLAGHFQLPRLQDLIKSPLVKLQMNEFDVTAHVEGGGINAQAEAIRLGIARALVMKDESLKKQLRTLGYLTRDPRAVERKKPGLKKARRAPQWAKR
jgi:small subunit ribosomal protein S9